MEVDVYCHLNILAPILCTCNFQVNHTKIVVREIPQLLTLRGISGGYVTILAQINMKTKTSQCFPDFADFATERLDTYMYNNKALDTH